jgi:predicted transcriptional regulator
MKVKEAAIEIVKNLPEDCSWEDIMYQIYVREKIEAGLRAADEGRVMDHDEFFKEFEE